MRLIMILFLFCSCTVPKAQNFEFVKSSTYYGFDGGKEIFSNLVELGSEVIRIEKITQSTKNDFTRITGVVLSDLSDIKLNEVKVFIGTKEGEVIDNLKNVGMTNKDGKFDIEIPSEFTGQLIFWKESFLATAYKLAPK